MKALFIFNPSSGKGKILKKLDYVQSELEKAFDEVEVVASKSKEHFIQTCKDACGVYDALIFAGGDGTFNMVVNAIGREEHRPVLGLIPTGTTNCAAENFGISKNIKKAVKIITNKKEKRFDICTLNDRFFVFCAAIGILADVPYKTKKKYKEKLGTMAYYFKAFPLFFRGRKVKGKVKFSNGETYPFKAAFVLLLNGMSVGGVKLKKKPDINDGLVDLFLARPSVVDSFFTYFLNRKKIPHWQVSVVEIEHNSKECWDIDGEEGPKGNGTIKVYKEHFSIFCK